MNKRDMSATHENSNSSSPPAAIDTTYSSAPWSSAGTLNTTVRTSTPFPGNKQQRPFGTSVGYNFGTSASTNSSGGSSGLGRQIRGRPKALGSLFGRANSLADVEESSPPPTDEKVPSSSVCSTTTCAEAETGTEPTDQTQLQDNQTAADDTDVNDENSAPGSAISGVGFKKSRQLLGKSAGVILPTFTTNDDDFEISNVEPTVKRSRLSDVCDTERSESKKEVELLDPREHEFQLQNLREEASNLKEKYKEATERFTGELNTILEGIKRSIQTHVETRVGELDEEDSQNKQILHRSKQIDKVMKLLHAARQSDDAGESFGDDYMPDEKLL